MPMLLPFSLQHCGWVWLVSSMTTLKLSKRNPKDLLQDGNCSGKLSRDFLLAY